MIEETLDCISASLEETKEKFYGVTVGRVINPLDPMALGRVQVQLPFIDSLDLSPWARVAVPMAGLAHGTYFIPNLGDEVLVAFEHGDINAPYIIGSLWNATAPPPLPSPVAQIRMIKTPLGNQIMFTEAPPSIVINSADMLHSVVIASTGVQIVSGASVINMTADGITITGTPNLNLVATGTLNINAPNITINGAVATNVQSGGVCNVTAPLVKIN
ncbi:phage baseplate assembly protein V [Candidatus Zixiibacteriota bacterium]